MAFPILHAVKSTRKYSVFLPQMETVSDLRLFLNRRKRPDFETTADFEVQRGDVLDQSASTWRADQISGSRGQVRDDKDIQVHLSTIHL